MSAADHPPVQRCPHDAAAASSEARPPEGAAPSAAGTEDLAAPGSGPPERAPAALMGPLPGAAADGTPLAGSAPHASSDADVEAGTGQPLPSAAGSSTTSRTESVGTALHTVTARSIWRWPSRPGKLPAYVEGKFRVKTFGLLTMQFVVVLGIMVAVDQHVPLPELLPMAAHSHVAFVAVGLLTMFALTALYCARDRHPANYLLLVLVTLLVGFYWGMGHVIFDSKLHFQLVGIMGIGVLVATIVSALFSYQPKADSWFVVLLSVYLGWAVGSAVDMTIVRQFPCLQGQWEAVAVLVAFFLFTVLVLDVGARLARGNPDDFMRVIISMDSALLVVVSIPIFIISACLLHTDDYPEILGANRPAEPRERPA